MKIGTLAAASLVLACLVAGPGAFAQSDCTKTVPPSPLLVSDR